MDSDRDVTIESTNDLFNLSLSETVQVGHWLVTRVPGGWIYTLKNSSAALGHAIADYHSIFIPVYH